MPSTRAAAAILRVVLGLTAIVTALPLAIPMQQPFALAYGWPARSSYAGAAQEASTSTRTPAALDNDASVTLAAVLENVDEDFPGIAGVVADLERKGRLALLRPWLEARVERGSTDVAVHTALAKAYVDANAADRFISTDNFYDAVVVGRYCEERDPYLAVMAYRHGAHDDDVIRMTDAYSMFDTQARYLVSRRDLKLWKHVLRATNPWLDQIVAAVVSIDATDELDVTTMNRAFSLAKLDESLFRALHGFTKR